MATSQYGLKDLEADARSLITLSGYITPRRELTPSEVHKLLKAALLGGITFIYEVVVNFESLLDGNRSYHCQIDEAFDKVMSELACFRHSHSQSAGREDSDEIDEICSIIDCINIEVKYLDLTSEESSRLKEILNLFTIFILNIMNVLAPPGETLEACSYFPQNTETVSGKSEFPAVAKFVLTLQSFCSSPVPSTEVETSVRTLESLLSQWTLEDSTSIQAVPSNRSFAPPSTSVWKKINNRRKEGRKPKRRKEGRKPRNATLRRRVAKPSSIKLNIPACNIPSKGYGFGLPNIGNTCWFNSTVKALEYALYSHIPHTRFRNISCSPLTFKIFSILDSLNQNQLVDRRLRSYLRHATRLIAVRFGWELGKEQDAGKFFEQMFEKTDLIDVLNSQLGVTTQVKLSLKTECASCRHSELKEKTFKVIRVTPKLSDENDDSPLLQKIAKQHCDSKCCRCGSKAVTGTFTFLTAPDLMIVFIVRASLRDKVLTALDLMKPLDVVHEGKSYWYRLKAVMCHIGKECRSGHYVTYTIGDSSGPTPIYKHNDALVYRPSQPEELSSSKIDIAENSVIAIYSKERRFDRHTSGANDPEPMEIP